MGGVQPTVMRWAASLLAAGLIAVVFTGLLSVFANALAGMSSVSLQQVFALLAAFVFMALLIVPFAIATGIIGAILFLGPCMMVATFLSARHIGYCFAGAIAGLAHFATVSLYATTQFRIGVGDLAFWLGGSLLGQRSSADEIMTVAVSEVLAGVAAGGVFAVLFIKRGTVGEPAEN